MPGTDYTVVTAMGMHTGFGRAADSAAAFRCGLSRLRELQNWPFFDTATLHEHALAGHTAAGLERGLQGMARYIWMITRTLRDLMSGDAAHGLPLTRLPILLLMPRPEHGGNDIEQWMPAILSAISRETGIPATTESVRPYFLGRGGTGVVLDHAKHILASGEYRHCIVAAVDSLLAPGRLHALLEAGRLRTPDAPTGLFPGEAAVALLVENPSKANDRASVPIMEILSAITTNETPPAEDGEPVPTGNALSIAMSRSLATSEPRTDGTIISDLNGEVFRAADFGNALVRVSARLPIASWRHELPALSFGDTGAASGLLALVLGGRGFLRNYLPAGPLLVSLSSSNGKRVAIMARRSL